MWTRSFFGEYGNQCSSLTFAGNAWKLLFGPSRRTQWHGRDPCYEIMSCQSLYKACPSTIFIQMGKFSLENRLQCIWSIESRQPIMHFTGSSKKPPQPSVRRVLKNIPMAVVVRCLVYTFRMMLDTFGCWRRDALLCLSCSLVSPQTQPCFAL